MKRLILGLAFLLCVCLSVFAEEFSLPESIKVGGQEFHVQGIVFDKQHKHFYLSFTTCLLKTDIDGNVLGSVDSIPGHLGAISINPDNGKIYASLECKNDVVGSSISKKLQKKNYQLSKFYVAVFDPNKITHTGMIASESDVMKTVYIKEAVDDYNAKVNVDDSEKLHRYACSGIDGITFAPDKSGKSGMKNVLVVAYGVYGDTLRSDNDCQVLLCYDIQDLEKNLQPVNWNKLHTVGPRKPLDKIFVYTGNTNYGVQNLAYDTYTGYCFMAVYRGNKSKFPNYSLFAVDWSKDLEQKILPGSDNPEETVNMLPLAAVGNYDIESQIRGWNFKYGSTGMCSLGNGLFYISEPGKDNGKFFSNVMLYRLDLNSGKPFVYNRK